MAFWWWEDLTASPWPESLPVQCASDPLPEAGQTSESLPVSSDCSGKAPSGPIFDHELTGAQALPLDPRPQSGQMLGCSGQASGRGSQGDGGGGGGPRRKPSDRAGPPLNRVGPGRAGPPLDDDLVDGSGAVVDRVRPPPQTGDGPGRAGGSGGGMRQISDTLLSVSSQPPLQTPLRHPTPSFPRCRGLAALFPLLRV